MIPAGLGTSSILGGCILAGLFRASGNLCDLDSLVHAVSLSVHKYIHTFLSTTYVGTYICTMYTTCFCSGFVVSYVRVHT